MLLNLFYLNLKGIISAIEFRSSSVPSSADQLKNTSWKDIPMLSVITGLNGIGKSTILKYVHQCVDKLVTVKGQDQIDLSVMEKIYGMNFSTNSRVKALLVDDNKARDQKSGNKPDSTNISDNKISIRKLSNTVELLTILKNELIDLSAFIKEKKFKYTRIYVSTETPSNNENDNAFSSNMKLANEDTNIQISDLSSGENLIFRLLIWQYIFKQKKFRPSEKCVLLLDEPDSHLHPSAIKNLLDNLKDLCNLGVQIILTTHNPTTVSFIERENLFLLEKQSGTLSIRPGLSATEIYHKLTSRLVNIKAPSRKIFVEGKDEAFYELIQMFLIDTNLVGNHFQLNFMSLPGGSKNSEEILNFMNYVEPSNEDPVYDSIHSYYGIVDDDNNRLKKNTATKEHKKRHLKNLFVFNTVNV